MKRVTLLADDVREVPGNYRVLTFSGEPGYPRHVHARHILAIEDADGRDFAPLPLPTEPGERFWGRSVDEPEPQYWFVRGPASTEEAHDTAARALVYYVPSCSSDSIVRAAVAQSVGLVRLPDPKAPEVTA
jgi:hypothetical protein